MANRVLGPRFEDEEKEKTREGMIRNVEEKEVSWERMFNPMHGSLKNDLRKSR